MSRRAVADFVRKRARLLVVVAILVEMELEFAFGPESSDLARIATALAAVAYAAPLAVRRDSPGEALIVSGLVGALQGALGLDVMGANGSLLVPLLLAYSVGSRLRPRAGATYMAIGYVLFALVSLDAAPRPATAGQALGALFFAAILLLAPWFVGSVTRERERRADAFRVLANQAQAERAERERAAVAEERLRIGGELQDVIAHSVTAMVIGAGGARRMLASQPDRARASILTVEETGRETLADMRRLLGVLRQQEDPRALAPQPGLDQLGDLIDAVCGRGLKCSLEIEGDPIDLTPGIDLLSYRAVETALAQAAATGSGSAAVKVVYSPEELILVVRGTGGAAVPAKDLDGLAERIALYDGTLAFSCEPESSFTATARLPLYSAQVA
jgi:signal transduction histidine kinase